MSASNHVKSIFLEDFQAHAKTKIELPGPGSLTVIVGPTDSGKTAIVRGLRLLHYNVPLGIEYIRVGRNMATVAVEMADDTKVARERSKSVNRYRVVKPGQNPQVFEGFGNSVPLEVQEATGVRVVTVGDLDLTLNLSEQLDGPFLGKAVSGPAKAKILGKLAGTEEVDAAGQAVGLDLHRAGQEETRLTDDIKALDATITEYDYLPALSEQIAALEALLADVRTLQTRLAGLEGASQRLAGIRTQRTQALGVMARWGGLPTAASHVEYAEAAYNKARVLVGHQSSLGSIASQRGEWQRRLSRWVNLPEASDLAVQAAAAHKRATAMAGLQSDLAVTRTGIERVQATLRRWTNLAAANAMSSDCGAAIPRLRTLESLNLRLVNIQTDAAKATKARDRWANLAEARSISSTADELISRLSTLTGVSNSLVRVRQAQVVAESDLDRHTKALGDARSLYTDTLIALGTCPLCGSKVDPLSLISHLKEVA